MNYQNNIGGQERQIKSASKFLGIELFFIIIFVSLIAFALNYFNLLPLSQIFPGQLGWVPHREAVRSLEKKEINGTSQKAAAKNLAEDKIITYASEVLNPNYLPKGFPEELTTEVSPQWQQKKYHMEFVVNEIKIMVEYFESIKGRKFDQDGLPLAMAIIIDREGTNVKEVADNNIRNYLGGFFNFTQDNISWREFNIPDGSPAIETSWDNPDGTIETRGSRRYGQRHGQTLPDGTVNIRNMACRIFPRSSPFYERRTCFE